MEDYELQKIFTPPLQGSVMYSVPKGYKASYLNKTLQGSILKLENIYDKKEKKLILKQSFKYCVDSNITLLSKNIKENVYNEYKMLLKLNKYNGIAKIAHKWYSDEHSYYFSVEYCEHGDLYSFLQQSLLLFNKYQLEDAILLKNFKNIYYNIIVPNIFYEICLKVLELHKKNIAHLDLSLENIVIDTNMSLKLIDFGVAKQFDKFDNNQIKYNKMVGKNGYMAPEVFCAGLNDNNNFDPFKADVWSLGVILYILYCYNYPFPKFGIFNNTLTFPNYVPCNIVQLLQQQIFIPEYNRISLIDICKQSLLSKNNNNQRQNFLFHYKIDMKKILEAC